MTHDTPPKRITREEAQAAVDPMLIAEILRDFGTNFDGIYPVDVLARGVGPEQSMIGLAIKRGHLITTSEAEAMVAAALREAAELVADDHVSDAILNLADNHAAAALDKLIAEAVAAATPTMQRAARVLHDEAMAAAYLGENVTEDEAAMLQFIDALGGKTKVINALHALATATKGATP